MADEATGLNAPAASDQDRYEQLIDPSSNSTHARVIRLVGRDRHVLELGCSTGYMSRALQEHGCTVVGIEVDAAMAQRAQGRCQRVLVADVETMDWTQVLGDERFDVIVAADVLEHLKDPGAVLRRARSYLRPDGTIVISLPNIAHGSVRLALLSGRFPYSQVGLLDRTHLRFFTLATMLALFEEAGLMVRHLERLAVGVFDSEVLVDPSGLPPAVLEGLSADPDATTYQFVVVVSPMTAAERLVAQQHRRALTDHEQALVYVQRGLRGSMEFLQAELMRRNEALAEQATGIQWLQLELASRDEALVQRDQVIADLRTSRALLEQQASDTRQREQALRATMQQRDADIGRLQEQVAQQAEGIAWLRQEVSLRDSRLAELALAPRRPSVNAGRLLHGARRLVGPAEGLLVAVARRVLPHRVKVMLRRSWTSSPR